MRNRRRTTTVFALVGVIAGMFGLTAASVPLYRLFCQATGYGGTTQRAEEAPDKVAAQTVTVRFDTSTAGDLGWEFRPLQRSVTIHPGEETLVAFRAVNRSPLPVVGRATFNVTPLKVGVYFDKIQCFCFDEQRLEPGESVDMPVTFFVDPKMLTDPTTSEVRTITLSYTMFRAKDAPKSVAQRPQQGGSDRTTIN